MLARAQVLWASICRAQVLWVSVDRAHVLLFPALAVLRCSVVLTVLGRWQQGAMLLCSPCMVVPPPSVAEGWARVAVPPPNYSELVSGAERRGQREELPLLPCLLGCCMPTTYLTKFLKRVYLLA